MWGVRERGMVEWERKGVRGRERESLIFNVGFDVYERKYNCIVER